MTYYIYSRYSRLKSEKEKNEDKLEKKNREVQNTKGVKFSNKNFFRGK